MGCSWLPYGSFFPQAGLSNKHLHYPMLRLPAGPLWGPCGKESLVSILEAILLLGNELALTFTGAEPFSPFEGGRIYHQNICKKYQSVHITSLIKKHQ